MTNADEATQIYLVTGATGFLGRRLVAKLLTQDAAARVIAMARPNDPQQADAEHHIADRMGDSTGRIEWLTSDVTRPMLGLDDAQVDRLSRTGPLNFLHLAAMYDLDVEEGLSKALNLDGAIHAYELALAIRRRPDRGDRPVRFCQTSTLAVAGTYQGPFGETGDELSAAAGTHTDWYSRHKHEAELALRSLAADGEVPLMIVRPGIAVGESETGAIEKLDGPYALLEYMRWPIAGHFLPAGSSDRLWMVPGDFVVRAIATLGASPAAYGHTFNLLYPPEEAPVWRELVDDTVRILRSRDYTGGGPAGVRAALRYGWYVRLPVRGIIRLCQAPLIGPLTKRIFLAMGATPHALYYSVDNPQYVVENYLKFGVDPPPPWRDVWRACVMYYRDHRDAMKAEARVAHQKDG